MNNNMEGFDICYTCGEVQQYLTMKEVNEVDFDILCDKCSENNEEKCDRCGKVDDNSETYYIANNPEELICGACNDRTK